MSNWGSIRRTWDDKRATPQPPRAAAAFVAVPRGTKSADGKPRPKPVKPAVDYLKGRVVFGP